MCGPGAHLLLLLLRSLRQVVLNGVQTGKRIPCAQAVPRQLHKHRRGRVPPPKPQHHREAGAPLAALERAVPRAGGFEACAQEGAP